MSSTTQYKGYTTYAPEDTDVPFLTFRTKTAGAGSDSNLYKIDEDIHELDDGVAALELSKANISHTHQKQDILSVNASAIDGVIDASHLPSYVDDVVEGYYYNGNFYKDAAHTQLITGESGKIYVDLATNKTYRWGGSTVKYVVISEGVVLGETSDTAYRGDRGKAAYDHISDNTRHITASERNDWNSKADGVHTHVKADITDFQHTHTKNEITDFPTNISTFTNDSGYVKTTDAVLTNKLNNNGDGSQVAVSFSQAASKANIGTGETLATICGKLMKWFSSFGALAWKSSVDYATTEVTNKPALKTVATSGSYNDLTNKPSFATVATSGSYNDLSNKPTIPSGALASLNSISYTSTYLTDKPTIPNITASTSEPTSSQGSNGDFWFVYEN